LPRIAVFNLPGALRAVRPGSALRPVNEDIKDFVYGSSSMGNGTQAMTKAVGAQGVTLRPGLSFFPLDGELVVFSEASQSLVGLNATAAFIVRKLQDGVPSPALAGLLATEKNVAPDEAASWVAATCDALGSQGLLADGTSPTAPTFDSSDMDKILARARSRVPPIAPFEPRAEGRYRLLGTCALIRFAHPAQMRMVDAVIGHLRSDEIGTPALTVDISAQHWGDRQICSDIYANGEPLARAEQLSTLGPLVKSVLWTTAVNAHDFLLYLHAGVVGKDGKCIFLPAAAGSGKSSLTAALAHGGFCYYSDEVALVERGTFLVPPVPLAVCVKSTGWDLMSRYYPEILALPIHGRNDGKVVRYVPPPAAALRQTPALVSHIFFPRYTEGEQTRLEPLSRSNALARLMEQCLALRQRLDQDNVRELIRWIGAIECYSLTFSSLDEAVALIENTVS
jgi:hypothetical protein